MKKVKVWAVHFDAPTWTAKVIAETIPRAVEIGTAIGEMEWKKGEEARRKASEQQFGRVAVGSSPPRINQVELVDEVWIDG